jgi:hypothetical protein
MHKLLTGRAPYAEYVSAAQKIHAHAHIPFPALPDFLPRSLQQVLDRMVAKSPAERYASPSELAAQLEPLTKDSTLDRVLFTAQPPTRSDIATDQSTPASNEVPTLDLHRPQPQQSPATRQRRRWIRWGVAILGALTAVTVIAIAVLHRPPEPTGPRNLDDLEPFLMHPLLDRPPTLAVWNRSGGDSVYRFDPRGQLLSISFPGNAMFHLGKIESSHFTFQIGIKQTLWAPGQGIYWGYREHNLPEGMQAKAIFQFLMVERDAAGKLGQQFYLTRGYGEVHVGREGQHRISKTRNYRSAMDDPLAEQVLSIRIANYQLLSVMMQGKLMPELASAEANKDFNPQDYKGYIGTVNILGSCVYRNALLRLDPPTDR